MNDVLKNTLTLSDALRLGKPLRYNVMVKVVGPACNLSCHYCYYLDKSRLFADNHIMPLKLLEKLIKEYVETNATDDVVFNWHGGEPLIAGIDYYKDIIRLQKKYCSDKRIFNTLQTNATLMNADFATFFKDNNFLIGVSVDGPQDIHDKYRKDRCGASTFIKVLKGIELLHRYKVDFNTMTTVNKASEGRGLDVYMFLKQIGSRYMQFMPVVEYVDADGYIVPPNTLNSNIAAWSVDASAYGRFMCDIFDNWVQNDVGDYFVNLFDSTLANYCNVENGCCVYSETCGISAVVEHNGDVYPCDHYVYPQYALGNIVDNSIYDMVASDMMTRFGIDKRNRLPQKCLRCDCLFVCHGECPKHRFYKTEIGGNGLNYLCEGYRIFYSHVKPYMEKMKELLIKNRPPSEIMKIVL